MKSRSVLRAVANAILSLLVVATFMWGGCVSCEQYFMFPGKHQSCCNQAGQCERPGKNSPKPAKQDCNRLPLQRGEKLHALPLPSIVPAIVALFPPPALSPLAHLAAVEVLPDSSPPDLQSLHATFLI
jgi:hypothetical protein